MTPSLTSRTPSATLGNLTSHITSLFCLPWALDPFQPCPGPGAPRPQPDPQPPCLQSHRSGLDPKWPSRIFLVWALTLCLPVHSSQLLSREPRAQPTALSVALEAPDSLTLPPLHHHQVPGAPGPSETLQVSVHLLSPAGLPPFLKHLHLRGPPTSLLSTPSSAPFVLGAGPDQQGHCLLNHLLCSSPQP